MSEAPLPTSALMQPASTLLLSALIPTHPTTFHITSCWGALFCPDSVRLSMWCVVVSSWSYSSQLSEIAWVKKSRFTPLCFISLQSIYEDLFQFLCIYFAKQSKYFFINSLGNSRNLWHYQWPAEFIKQRKPASKWHQIALYERWIFLFFFWGGGGGGGVGCEQPYYFEIHGTIIDTL